MSITLTLDQIVTLLGASTAAPTPSPTSRVDEVGPGPFIVRTYSAGVFFARGLTRDGREATLTDSRRIWKWSGATELTDLAVNGPRKPDECRIGVAVPTRLVTEVIEVIPCTPAAAVVIDGIPAWTS